MSHGFISEAFLPVRAWLRHELRWIVVFDWQMNRHVQRGTRSFHLDQSVICQTGRISGEQTLS